MAKDNHDTLITNLVLIGAGYFLVKPMLEKVGLLNSAAAKEDIALVQKISADDCWNPNFYANYKTGMRKLITSASATAFAKQIHDAWGIVNDNEQKIYAAFRMLKNKLQVSQVVEKYSQLYKQDLLTRLRTPWFYAADGLDEKEFLEVIKIVNALPVNLY